MYRAISLSLLGSAGRVFSSLAPFIIFDMYNKNNYSPFILFGVL